MQVLSVCRGNIKPFVLLLITIRKPISIRVSNVEGRKPLATTKENKARKIKYKVREGIIDE